MMQHNKQTHLLQHRVVCPRFILYCSVICNVDNATLHTYNEMYNVELSLLSKATLDGSNSLYLLS